MQTDAHPIAHFVTRMANINGNQEPFEIEVTIRRAGSGPIIDNEPPLVSDTSRKGSPYIHAFTTNLSEANKQGLDNMAYWGIGPRKSKTYLMNQALAQYLAQFKESKQPVPIEES